MQNGKIDFVSESAGFGAVSYYENMTVRDPFATPTATPTATSKPTATPTADCDTHGDCDADGDATPVTPMPDSLHSPKPSKRASTR